MSIIFADLSMMIWITTIFIVLNLVFISYDFRDINEKNLLYVTVGVFFITVLIHWLALYSYTKLGPGALVILFFWQSQVVGCVISYFILPSIAISSALGFVTFLIYPTIMFYLNLHLP